VSTPPFRAAGRTRRGVQSRRELLGRAADAARVISGAHHSSWNGRLAPMPPNVGDHIAIAGWDGTLHFDQREIIEPLQEMFDQRGQEHDVRTLMRYRSALRAVLHENAHLLMPVGRRIGDPEERAAYHGDASARALVEGGIDAWTLHNLDRFIDVLGLEEIAPRLKSAPEEVKYPHLAAAADALAERLGEVSDLGSDDVLRRLVIEPTDRQWRVVGGLLYEASDLPDLQRGQRDAAQAKTWFEDAMRPAFVVLRDLPDHPKEPRAQARAAEYGRTIGEQAFRAGAERVAVLEQRYRQSSQMVVQKALGAVPPLTGVRRPDPDSLGNRASRPPTNAPTRQPPDRGVDG